MDKKEELLRCGRELFATKGFKDTSVADITKMAGMAAGTFYLYYPSKDQLFIELFMEENAKLKRSMFESVDPQGDPIDVMKQLMQKNLEGLNTNPILRQLHNREIRIERKGDILGNVGFVYDSIAAGVLKWQAEGKMRRDIDADMIVAIFAAIINMDTHKEEIGLQYFPKLMDYMAEFVMKGLMEHRDRV